jgi:hypothetical protein
VLSEASKIVLKTERRLLYKSQSSLIVSIPFQTLVLTRTLATACSVYATKLLPVRSHALVMYLCGYLRTWYLVIHKHEHDDKHTNVTVLESVRCICCYPRTSDINSNDNRYEHYFANLPRPPQQARAASTVEELPHEAHLNRQECKHSDLCEINYGRDGALLALASTIHMYAVICVRTQPVSSSCITLEVMTGVLRQYSLIVQCALTAGET